MSDFWSKRRAAVEAEAAADQVAEEERINLAREAALEERLAERSDEEILAELELPVPETLGHGDDFKVFLTEAVPARIKTRALRCLWGSNPVLANIDGLVDYGEDFTDAALAVEHLQTAYQVGKGMTAHVEELARQAEAKAQALEEKPEEHLEAPEDCPPEQVAQAAVEVPAPQEQGFASPDAEDVSGETSGDVAGEFSGDLSEDFAEDFPGELEDEFRVPTGTRRMRFTFDNGSPGEGPGERSAAAQPAVVARI